MPILSDLGERALVDLLRRAFDGEELAFQDDAAVLPLGDRHLLVTTDVVNAATHVPPGARPEDVGWYLVAVNLSDIAAMGGKPLGFLSALTLPRDLEVDYLEGLARGMRACAEAYDTDILGGDTKEGRDLSLCGVAVGRTRGSRVLRRKGCAPGDVLAVTGTLGRAGWAVRRLAAKEGDVEGLQALLRPEPRIPEGLLLAADPSVTACMDISDGLASSLGQLGTLNGASFRVEYEAVPTTPHLAHTPEEERREALLHEGGDFELLFTVRRGGWERLRGVLNEEFSGASAIGEVRESGKNLLVVSSREEELEARGYEHFRSRDA